MVWGCDPVRWGWVYIHNCCLDLGIRRAGHELGGLGLDEAHKLAAVVGEV